MNGLRYHYQRSGDHGKRQLEGLCYCSRAKLVFMGVVRDNFRI